MTYKGSCHCGRISFEVEGEIDNVVQCNCSICTKRGNLLWFVPRQQLRVSTPDTNMRTYMFNKKVISHRFCPACGCGPFGEGVNPKTGQSMAAINIRCLEDIDLSKLNVVPFDGRSLS